MLPGCHCVVVLPVRSLGRFNFTGFGVNQALAVLTSTYRVSFDAETNSFRLRPYLRYDIMPMGTGHFG
jgi:hypothetical protein